MLNFKWQVDMLDYVLELWNKIKYTVIKLINTLEAKVNKLTNEAKQNNATIQLQLNKRSLSDFGRKQIIFKLLSKAFERGHIFCM